MESRICGIFLRCCALATLCAGTVPLRATAADQPEQVVRPEIERRDISEADIDTEDFEVGAFFGAMNVEDFGTNPVYGARLTYHVTEYVFAEAAYGHTDTSETSFERLSGSAQLLDSSDRKLDYYNLSFGFNVLPGESFVGGRWAFTSDFYLVGGVGSTSFAGEDNFTWNFGFGYKVLANDWLALRVDARDHVFDVDLLGEKQTNHNLELTGGVSIFF
ncbi:MAG: outer membrane beta-barrel domain-containing protein [Thiogranum sp.]|jgi:outer membrane beta-barrel protein|nr:outer membrane beta-barrel domain-containing protein [Thiogranum sp.]